MGLGAPFCDCQPKAASARFARTRFIDAIEAIEHFVSVFGSDARPGIFDFDGYALRAYANNAYRDASACRCKRSTPSGA